MRVDGLRCLAGERLCPARQASPTSPPDRPISFPTNHMVQGRAINGSACDHRWMEFADAAARNEEVFREVNERIDEGAERHHVEGPLPFHCECCDASCVEKLPISAREYKRVVEQRFWFVVIPGHETTAVERVVERQPEYFVVEKVGEAREQLERDHPQKRHQRPSPE